MERIVLLAESANPFHPKAIRASAGTVLSVNLYVGPSLKDLRGDLPVVALAASGRPIANFTFPDSFCLLPGMEGPGLDSRWLDNAVSIPMAEDVESLNAATATAITLYEWRRQRKRRIKPMASILGKKLLFILCVSITLGCTLSMATDVRENASAAGNDVALDLYSRLADSDGNFFFSPASIETALAMTYAGSKSRTAAQMAKVLHVEKAGQEVHQEFQSLLQQLNTPSMVKSYEKVAMRSSRSRNPPMSWSSQCALGATGLSLEPGVSDADGNPITGPACGRSISQIILMKPAKQ